MAAMLVCKAMSTIPGISDHDAIVADCDIRPAFCKKKPRTICLVADESRYEQLHIYIPGSLSQPLSGRKLVLV